MEINDRNEILKENQSRFVEFDNKALADIANEFREFKIEDRLEKMRGMPSKFETREDFEKDWVKAEVSRPLPSGLEGFTDDRLKESAKVSIEKPFMVQSTNLHERLHQASDPDFKSQEPRALKEGITQALTDKIMGTKNVTFLDESGIRHQCYPEETKLAEGMIAEAGFEAVEKFYVRNDASELKKALGGDAQYEALENEFKRLTKLKENQGLS